MMTLRLTAALLAATLLCSCVESRIGLRIREMGEVHTGVDYLHPVDGKVYQTPAQRSKKPPQACVLAPEITYRVGHSFYHLHAPYDCDLTSQYGIRPTGRTLVARIDCGRADSYTKLLKDEVGGTIPAGARPSPAEGLIRPGKFDQIDYGDLAPVTPSPAWRSIAAAPFDYLIDPVLSAAGTTVLWTGILVATPVLYVSHQIHRATRSSPATTEP